MFIVALSISACIYVSCENSEIEPINNSNCIIDIKGADEFKNSLRDLSGKAISRSGCDDHLAEDIETLIEISHEFLERNEIALEDLNIKNGEDEILVIVAMSLLDYQNISESTDNQTYVGRTSPGGCVLQALGVKEIVETAGKAGAKQVAKVVAKVALKKAIPYLGWAMFAWDYIECVTEE